MHEKFEINWTKIKGSCQSRRKVVTHNSKSDLPLIFENIYVTQNLEKFYTVRSSYPSKILQRRINDPECATFIDRKIAAKVQNEVSVPFSTLHFK